MYKVEIFPETMQSIHVFDDSQGRMWVRSTDLCEVLDFADAWQAVEQHAKRYAQEWKVGMGRPAQYLSEPGFYRMVFASKAPIALAFQDWVFDIVLPSLRQTGGYQAPPTAAAESAPLPSPGSAADAVIEQMLNHMLATSDPCQIKQLAEGLQAAMRVKTRGGIGFTGGNVLQDDGAKTSLESNSYCQPKPIADRILDRLNYFVDRQDVRWSRVINDVGLNGSQAAPFQDEVLARCAENNITWYTNARGTLFFTRTAPA